jgi:hypothetical protein
MLPVSLYRGAREAARKSPRSQGLVREEAGSARSRSVDSPRASFDRAPFEMRQARLDSRERCT